MAQPWVKGYNRNVYVKDFFKYVDIDEGRPQDDAMKRLPLIAWPVPGAEPGCGPG